MGKLSRQRLEIELLSRNYIDSKIRLREFEEKKVKYHPDRVNTFKRIVSHIEDVTSSLPDKQKLIIENEVIYGKSGTWYLEFFSAPSYYRHRAAAYDNFLRCL